MPPAAEVAKQEHLVSRPFGHTGGALKNSGLKLRPGIKKPLPPKKKKVRGGGCCGSLKKKNTLHSTKPKSKNKSKISFSSLFKHKAANKPPGRRLSKNVKSLPKQGITTPLDPSTIGKVPEQLQSQQLSTKQNKSMRKLKHKGSPSVGNTIAPKSPVPTDDALVHSKSMIRPKALTTRAHDTKSKALSPPTSKDDILPVSPAILAAESPAIQQDEQPTKLGLIETTKTKRKLLSLSHIRALETSRVFQEVKLCVATRDNGMTERRVLLTSVYPTGNPPKIAKERGALRRKPSLTYASPSNADVTETVSTTINNFSSICNTLDSANSMAQNKPPSDKDPLVLSPPIKNFCSTKGKTGRQVVPTSHERAMSTILQLRGHYQLNHNEVRALSQNPELKSGTIRAGIALQEAQKTLRNLKILAGTHLLPDLSYFADKLHAFILELDRFIDAIHTVSENANFSPSSDQRLPI